MELLAETQTATATVDSDGNVLIPPAMRSFLGISPGTPVVVRVESGRIVIEPLERMLKELQELFAGGPSLEDELYKDRRSDKW